MTEPEPPRRPAPGPGRGLAIRPNADLVRAAPGLAKVVAESAWHVMSWGLGATIAGANYVARRAVDGEPAAAILQDAASDLRGAAWRALGVQGDVIAPPPDRSAPHPASTAELQQRGEDLLRRSNDVHVVEDTHPAFARILSEITPDEARVLRLLYLDGPQPSLDIRTWRPFGIGSELVASGLSMIGEHAGLRSLDRLDQYLTNLSRLGLLDFSPEQVSNPTRYQVIEAQPKVVAALKRAGRMPKMIQRSVRLTAFGEEFVRTCLPLDGRALPNRPEPGPPRAQVLPANPPRAAATVANPLPHLPAQMPPPPQLPDADAGRTGRRRRRSPKY